MEGKIKKSYKIILLVIALLVGVISYLGISYASLEKKEVELPSSSVVTIDNLSITYFDNKEINATLNPKEQYKLRFSITNSSLDDVYYSLGIDDVINMIDGEVLLNIIANNGGGTIENGNYPKEASEIINQIKIAGETTQTYELNLKNLSGTTGEVGGKIKVTILNDTINEEEETYKNFASIILENNVVGTPKTNVGKEVSREAEGLIKDEDDLGTTYYFRGKVVNNYVSFGGFTWRIVRINGDSSVRLILDDILNETTIYNNVNESNYLESYKFNDSAISLFLNSWYEDNLKEVDDKIIVGSYCNDYEVVNTEGYNEQYSDYKKVNEGPSFKCNNKISLKVGLINASEMIYAGNSGLENSVNSYLFNPKIINDWWTMSASYRDTNNGELYVYSVNAFANNLKDVTLITSEKGIRPVINLNKMVTVSGSGTIDDPYQVI